jgi:flagellar biosynthesis GTPase FlhF
MAANKIDDEIDALFRLPLAEFIGARKTLAARLKKEGQAETADRVKALVKPPISVWAVNQLYWSHRDEFDGLIAAGQRFRRAHTTRTSKAGELNEALDARREALNHLSDLASALLREGGHNPSLDTMRRIDTTLEAMSAYPVLPDDQAAGRLTKDLDPPGFESLAPFIRAVATTRRPDENTRVSAANKSASSAKKTQQNSAATTREARDVEKTHQAKLAAAKAALQHAKKSLVDARATALRLQTAQKKADVEVKNAEKQKREAEQRFKEASSASAAAAVRAQNIEREAGRAAKAVDDAERNVERASKELESL